MSNECTNAYIITSIACQLMCCLEPDEIEILAADLMQLADTLVAMQVRQNICGNETGK